MSEAYKIQGATLDAIAEAIQEARGITEAISPADMPRWILGTKQEEFPGPYSFTYNQQIRGMTVKDTYTVNTQNKIMTSDFVINPVPVSDVDNLSGGRTYTIGG